MNKIIVIVGPTGVGKTKLSIELAKRYDAEIINGDSIQIYKDLNIGSAKATIEEREGIPHHLLDFKNIDEEYSVYDYQKDCRNKIDEIRKRNKNIIIVGGTGLYIKAALFDYRFNKEEKSNNNYENYTNDELYNILLEKEPNTLIHKNNRQRVIRAIEKENINENNNCNDLLYDAIFIGLTTDRENLYDIINKRVDIMINSGLIEETKELYNKYPNSKALNTAIGYKELIEYLNNNITLDEAIELIKKNSRRYAKRQYTWFNNQIDIDWFDVDYDNFDNTITNVTKRCD
ncbi:MAG: tRNA (adenosine(37)-N6)-dimethylallyltransferase MiaA [Firmicutes bacterium]|nr:tRNA (adenosine(37)-N6)-dimethylallyltransferase MiaA [Bacillota bacterium]